MFEILALSWLMVTTPVNQITFTKEQEETLNQEEKNDEALYVARSRMENLLNEALSEGVLQREGGVQSSNITSPADSGALTKSVLRHKCLDNLDLFLGFTDKTYDQRATISALRGKLVGEFDKPDMAIVEELSRAYLGLFLTDEFKSLLKSFPKPFKYRSILLEISSIIEAKEHNLTTDSRFSSLFICPGLHGIWQSIRISERNDLFRVESPDEKYIQQNVAEQALIAGGVEALHQLPTELRHEILPRFAIALAREEQWEWAISLYEDCAKLNCNNDYFLYLKALIARYENRPEDVKNILQQLSISASSISARAHIDFQALLQNYQSSPDNYIQENAILTRLNHGQVISRIAELRAFKAASLTPLSAPVLKATLNKLQQLSKDHPQSKHEIEEITIQTLMTAFDNTNIDTQIGGLEYYISQPLHIGASSAMKALHLRASKLLAELELPEEASKAMQRAGKGKVLDSVAKESAPISESFISKLDMEFKKLNEQSNSQTLDNVLIASQDELKILRLALESSQNFLENQENDDG